MFTINLEDGREAASKASILKYRLWAFFCLNWWILSTCHKPSIGPGELPHKIWTRSFQPFWCLLDTNTQINTRTRDTNNKTTLNPVKAGRSESMKAWGGGGFGPPLEKGLRELVKGRNACSSPIFHVQLKEKKVIPITLIWKCFYLCLYTNLKMFLFMPLHNLLVEI